MVAQPAYRPPVLPPAVEGPGFLQDGTEVWVRTPRPTDREFVREFAEREAMDALPQRYFTALRSTVAPGSATPSPDERLCLLALGDPHERVVVLGVGEYSRSRTVSDVAEVGFLVAGAFRRRGIAMLLMSRLARAALGYGILCFDARVPTETSETMEVFRGRGLPIAEQPAGGEVHFLIPLTSEVRAKGAPEIRAPLAGDRPDPSHPRRSYSTTNWA